MPGQNVRPPALKQPAIHNNSEYSQLEVYKPHILFNRIVSSMPSIWSSSSATNSHGKNQSTGGATHSRRQRLSQPGRSIHQNVAQRLKIKAGAKTTHEERWCGWNCVDGTSMDNSPEISPPPKNVWISRGMWNVSLSHHEYEKTDETLMSQQSSNFSLGWQGVLSFYSRYHAILPQPLQHR